MGVSLTVQGNAKCFEIHIEGLFASLKCHFFPLFFFLDLENIFCDALTAKNKGSNPLLSANSSFRKQGEFIKKKVLDLFINLSILIYFILIFY